VKRRDPKRFQAKWIPVRVKKTRQTKSFLNRRFRQMGFGRTEHVLKRLPDSNIDVFYDVVTLAAG
jgi:hypothetical protein